MNTRLHEYRDLDDASFQPMKDDCWEVLSHTDLAVSFATSCTTFEVSKHASSRFAYSAVISSHFRSFAVVWCASLYLLHSQQCIITTREGLELDSSRAENTLDIYHNLSFV